MNVRVPAFGARFVCIVYLLLLFFIRVAELMSLFLNVQENEGNKCNTCVYVCVCNENHYMSYFFME